MACFSVTKVGILTVPDLIDDVVAEMTGNVAAGANNSIEYFERVFDGTSDSFPGGNRIIILKSKFPVDPLANATVVGSTIVSNTEPGWRVCFNIEPDNKKVHVHVGTDLQLTDTGEVAKLTNRSLTNLVTREPVGNLAETWTGSNGAAPLATDFNQYWLNRTSTATGFEGAYPMSYLLTLTNRGVFLAVWEGSQEEVPQALAGPFAADNPNPDPYGYGNSPLRWFLIQRPVDRLTGHVRGGGALRESNDPADEKSRCPVIAVAGYGNPPKYRKMVVRETDVPVPSRKRLADVQTEDQPAMLSPYQQQSLTENGEFIVTFLNSINTSRFRYADELDMLGTVSARVVGPGTSITVRVYDETDDQGNPIYRQYTSLYATERYGSGMRVMVLTRVGVDKNDPTDTSPAAIARSLAAEDAHVIHPGA